ncbi:MmcQ/YjbR family DNA-binding protein [Streptomyces guryensis]|uniref:MmcQ/YjbR family DNA-binding protein n=1 Tax=Streptomyces guryensis TaxID=2886947 RepID=A0A9Q3VWV0_9ACTN|nr:MmcQ/YjbR family DNA-binding protein [Streptomyces guryensis]MCD9880029.1 MmcQ/YjbR family DNA-binding protein [Streptomyces guryensis]
MTPAEERFDDLVTELLGLPGVTPPGGSGFGRSALRVHNKIFAMLVRGQLVVKLPGERVDGLVDGGEGGNFDANKGTPMKEWFALSPDSTLDWSPLAREALAFVGGRHKGPAGD